MKRGNTALKRGVGLASAFALAITGAVIAAPAASAFTDPAPADSLIRATPTADAGWLDGDGNARTAKDAVGTVYDGTHATGQVPVVKVANLQQGSDLQILLPVNDGTTVAGDIGLPGWTGGEKITLSLPTTTPQTIAWQKLAVSATLQAKAVVASDLGERAGWNGNGGHASNAGLDGGQINGGTDINLTTKVTYVGDTQMQIELPDTTTGTTAALTPTDAAYLLTIKNVRFNVKDGFVPLTAQSRAVTVALTDGGSAPVGATTIAYATPFSLSTEGDTTVTNGVVNLPKITVSEDFVDSFNGTAGQTLALSVTSDKDASVTVNAPTGATLKLNNVVQPAASLTVGAGSINGVTGTTSDTKFESLNFSGLTVSGVSAGAKLTITLTDPSRVAQNGATVDGTIGSPVTNSTFSFVPDQKGAGLSVTVDPSSVLPRTAGDNRYETAAMLAAPGGQSAIVIANGENAKQGIDALSANFLAGVKGAPILLTKADTLPKETKDALTALWEDGSSVTVYFMGKTDSISQAVRDEIVSTLKATVNKAATITVKQIAGDDRYATSVASASEATLDIQQYDLGEGNLRTAFLASGQVNADALAAGSASAGAHVPVLLTSDGAELPESVSDAISSLVIQQVIILGGTDRVSTAVETALKDRGVNVLRLAGTGSEGRYATAVEIAKLARGILGSGFTFAGKTVYLANGAAGFPDALAVGPAAGAADNIVLTVPDGATIPSVTSTYLKGQTAGTFTAIQGIGGTDRVQDSVIQAALDAIGVKKFGQRKGS